VEEEERNHVEELPTEVPFVKLLVACFMVLSNYKI
jgi:hypothetical protein